MKKTLITLWKISLVVAVIILIVSAWNVSKEKAKEEVDTDTQVSHTSKQISLFSII